MIAAVTAVHGRLNESETPSAEYLALNAEECEINEPSASPLDCISAKRDNLESQLQSTVDAQGHIRITKVKHKLEVPVNSEHYRRIMKVEMYAWLAMAARFKAKAWLQGLTVTPFLKFTDYISGEKVSQLKIPTAQGSDQSAGFRPPWTTVLAYEFRLRKEAFRLVNEEGETLAEALTKVCKDTELKEVYFTTPLALASAEGSVRKYFKGAGKDHKGGKSDQATSSKGDGKLNKGKTSESQGYGGKTPGVFAGFTLLSQSPDGRQICYAFNSAKGCKGKCGRVHICRVKGCGKQHGVHQHPGVNKDSTGGTDQKTNEEALAKLVPGLQLVEVDISCGRGSEGDKDIQSGSAHPSGPSTASAVEIAIACYDHGSYFALDHPEQLGRASDDAVPATPWDWQESGATPRPIVRDCLHWTATLVTKARSQPKFPAELCDFIASAIAAVAPAGKGGSHTPACMDKNPVVGPPVLPPPGSSLSSTGSRLELTPQAQPSTCTTGDAANLCDPDASTCTTADTANLCNTDAFAENVCMDKNPVVSPPVENPPGSSLSSTGSSLKRAPQAPPNTCATDEAATFCNPDAENILRWIVPYLSDQSFVETTEWTPSARGARLGETARRFASAMHTLVKSFVLRVIPDAERSAMELVLGRYTSSPFSEKDMSQLRQQWVSLLGDSQGFDLLEVPERQPFFLPALARTAELLEDPDWEIVTQGNDNFCTGVPLGCEEVNNTIKIESQQAVPGPADLSYIVEEPIRRGEVPFCVSADVTAAHRLSKVRKQDWPYLACRVDDTSPTIWVNTVGTFGVSSASFSWSRLFGIIGRVVTRCLMQVLFFHLVFVDDLHANFSGRNRYLYTLMWLALFEMIGTPFSYKKFKGGFRVQFIGYELDYKSRTMGVSASRGRYVIEWIQNARRQRFVVLTRDFAEFLGRLGFIARRVQLQSEPSFHA
ncbi:unnamed protein product, partial [Symbiodinium necroappetens]